MGPMSAQTDSACLAWPCVFASPQASTSGNNLQQEWPGQTAPQDAVLHINNERFLAPETLFTHWCVPWSSVSASLSDARGVRLGTPLHGTNIRPARAVGCHDSGLLFAVSRLELPGL